jgi:hypothetical protein
MDSAQDIAALERELAEVEAQIRRLRIRRSGILTELEGWRAGVGEHSALGSMKATEAILEVLADAGTAMSIPELVARLNAGGRAQDDTRAVTSTLSHLKRTKRIDRSGRGLYELA